MRKQTNHSHKTFHVKHAALAAATVAMAASLCACQPPAEEDLGSVNITAIEEIAYSVAPSDVTPPEEEPNDAIKLPTVEEAEKATGIMAADAGSEYAEDEILVTLKSRVDIADINRQLSLCDFIKENRLGNEMMVVGEIRGGKVEKGSMDEAVFLLHTAEGVQVNQAIVGLQETNIFKQADPNYLLSATASSAE